MTIVHMSRASTPDELAAEMDRRGAVIEQLEAQIRSLAAERDERTRERDEARAHLRLAGEVGKRACDEIDELQRRLGIRPFLATLPNKETAR